MKRIVGRVVPTAVVALVLSAGAVGTAAASPTAEVGPEPLDRTVIAREDIGTVNVRDDPNTSATVDRKLAPGGEAWGDCWLEGEHVNQHGVSSNIWIDVGDPPWDYEYIWAGALKGDKYANLDPSDMC